MEEKESLSETRAEEVLSQRASAKKTSKESWYGTSILIVFGGAICVLFGSIGWWGYSRVYLPLQQEKTSISSLDQEVFESDKESVVIEEPLPEPKKETPTEVVLDITQESILVLNGGGAKGSAGEVATLLKKEGYSKASFGNTEKNYTGTTLYFASQKESVANEVKKILLKQYPKAVSQKANESDKETTGAPIVIILGK
ncbi:MAG: LytR C-terminal domain-containing protein [Candidatus Moranbacteria bacterium]|nr:LytR C-terminal domain-containing protein [Candidatus Moranbacteria bacterium]